MEGGAPLAVEKNLGRGRIIVQAIPFSLAWSSLPLCHAYVVMVHEWLWYLTEPGVVKRNLQAGELLQIALPASASNGNASLETPDGWMAHVAGEEYGGRLVFRYSKTMFPGEYNLRVSGAPPERFLVARDPEESNLTPLSTDQIASLAESGGLNFGADPLAQPDDGARVTAPPKAFAEWLLLALVLMMAAEAALAFGLARHRGSRTPAVTMEPRVPGYSR